MRKLAPLILLVILFGAALWYSLTRDLEPVHETPPEYTPPATEPEKPEQESEPLAQLEEVKTYIDPEPIIIEDPLLPLSESDTQVTQSLVELIGADQVTEYLVKDNAISRLVVTIDRLSSRQVPPLINPVKTAEDKFVVETEGERVVMSEQNFSRYDAYVALLQNVPAEGLLDVYQRYAPLFQQAWEENGGEGSFNQRLVEVVDHLLETPDVSAPVYLTKPEAVYLFEDPALEAMTAGQKILVRMGSANASIVKQKLAEIRPELNP